MHVRSIDERPLVEIPFLNAMGHGHYEEVRLPVLRAVTEGLPAGVDAVVATSDLQGRIRDERTGLPGALLGEAVPGLLAELAKRGGMPDPMRTGVFLCGDLYTVSDLAKKGGRGDVLEVWKAFMKVFRWVAGVAGNHDTLDLRDPQLGSAHALDGEACDLDGLSVAGVSGIIGNPKKPFRKTEADFLGAIQELLSRPASGSARGYPSARGGHTGPDVLLLHLGPSEYGGPVPCDGSLDCEADEEAEDSLGSGQVRAVLEEWAGDGLLVVCGHRHWQSPLTTLGGEGKAQALNVDKRVVVLVRPDRT